MLTLIFGGPKNGEQTNIPQSICLVHQRRPENTARYFPFEQFSKDAAGPETAFLAFCFIEPNFNGIAENDDHPPHDVMKAQKLMADVYNAIRSNAELWNSTLLVVLYDEDGGFFDQVDPPNAVSPTTQQPRTCGPGIRQWLRIASEAQPACFSSSASSGIRSKPRRS